MRWLIDGMNVIGSRPDGWWNNPDRAMLKMTALLDEYARLTSEDVTVVFDKKPKDWSTSQEVRVVFASWKGRNAADHEIEKIVSESDPTRMRVVTSDKRLAEIVTDRGATVVGSRSFREHLEKTLTQRL